MIRNVVASVAILVFGAALCGQDADPVKEKLFAAKVAYDTELRSIHKQIEEWFDKRESAARAAADLKMVELIKQERAEFEEDGDVPNEAPAVLQTQQTRALRALESAYTQAVKDYTRTKQDDRAAAVEGELQQLSTRLNGIDLLALVNPKTHTVTGSWKMSGRTLVGASAQTQQARLQLPYTPGEEYDVEVKCRYVTGDDCFAVGLVSGGTQVLAVVDGWPASGHVTGFDLVGGKDAASNSTTVKGRVLKRGGQMNTVLCTVRAEQIGLFVNGKRVTSYKGEFSQLRLHQDFRMPNQKALFVLFGPKASYHIEAIKVMPVKGKGTVLK